MPTAIMDSNEARSQWRGILDATSAGEKDIVITRYGKPVAVLIDYADWLAAQEILDDLRAARRADAAFEEYLQNPDSAKPWEEFEAELIAEGRFDANA
jgi:prevent-host-death family protein